MTQSDLSTAMDYVEALATARKAKRWLSLGVAAVIVGDLAIFFAFHFGRPMPAVTGPDYLADLLKTLVGLFEFLGVVLPLLLAADLLLILNILLLGRLSGISRIVGAFFWCLLLVTLLFPWQAFLANEAFTTDAFKIPGVLYSWAELAARGRWVSAGMDGKTLLLRWARFVVFPVISLIVLMLIQMKSSRGLKMAHGEARKDTRHA